MAPNPGNRPGTKGVPREERERQILDVASEEFGTRGYAAASIPDIAERAGISKPLVYNYFDGKDGLYLACARRAGDRLVDAVAGQQRGTDLSRALRTLEAIFGALEDRRHDWSILFDKSLPRGSEPHAVASDYRRRLTTMGSEAVAEVLAASDADSDRADVSLVGRLWLGTVTSVVEWWLDHPEHSARDMTQRCARILLHLQNM